jgi:hypothetical protein
MNIRLPSILTPTDDLILMCEAIALLASMVVTALVQDADDNLGKHRHMERVIFFCTSVSICPITMFFGKFL